VDLARRGDQEAFAELVRIHQHEVYTLAARIVVDRDLAGDVAQDAFVRAWRAIPRFRGDARFSTWMHRITVNTAFTHRERRKRRRTEPLEVANEPEAEGLTPERAGDVAGMRDELQRALASLPESLRAVVVLKDVYQWTHAEIGEQLGISVTAAKVRLHRGRKRLRDVLWHAEEDR
jgi:RNA polymerase sigma-70 factor (ECF subfamily)